MNQNKVAIALLLVTGLVVWVMWPQTEAVTVAPSIQFDRRTQEQKDVALASILPEGYLDSLTVWETQGKFDSSDTCAFWAPVDSGQPEMPPFWIGTVTELKQVLTQYQQTSAIPQGGPN